MLKIQSINIENPMLTATYQVVLHSAVLFFHCIFYWPILCNTEHPHNLIPQLLIFQRIQCFALRGLSFFVPALPNIRLTDRMFGIRYRGCRMFGMKTWQMFGMKKCRMSGIVCRLLGTESNRCSKQNMMEVRDEF